MHTRWDWKAREHATGVIHGMSSSKDSAITWCGRYIVVRWDNWTEMPTATAVTCVACLACYVEYGWGDNVLE